MKTIAEADQPGVIVFVNTMRPKALAARLGMKMDDAEDGHVPIREYGVGAQILRELGVRNMMFLSDTEPTRVAGLEGYGLTIEGWQRLSEERD